MPKNPWNQSGGNFFDSSSFGQKKTRMDTTTWSNMFSVRISSHNPFTNFGVTVGGPTMKFADLRAKAKPKACRKAAGSSSSSGGSSPGLDDSLQDMMDHSPGRPTLTWYIEPFGSKNLLRHKMANFFFICKAICLYKLVSSQRADIWITCNLTKLLSWI